MHCLYEAPCKIVCVCVCVLSCVCPLQPDCTLEDVCGPSTLAHIASKLNKLLILY